MKNEENQQWVFEEEAELVLPEDIHDLEVSGDYSERGPVVWADEPIPFTVQDPRTVEVVVCGTAR